MFQPLHLALASPRTTEDMSPLRPPRSVFHRSTFVSLLGQAALHVACMVLVVKVAQVYSPEVCMSDSRRLPGKVWLKSRFNPGYR